MKICFIYIFFILHFFFIKNIRFEFDSSNFLYTTTKIDNTSSSIIKKSNPAFCFNEGTKILCLNQELFDEYIPIEDLQLGNYVKTFKHGYRKIVKIIKGSFYNNPNNWNMCMYKMVKNEENEENGLLEDLIVTGSQSILVDSIEEKELNEQLFSRPTPMIDNKYLLLAAASPQFEQITTKKPFIYYHLVLDNEDDDEVMYGIWANGILTETPSKQYFKKEKFIQY
jgi:hypothetical protein